MSGVEDENIGTFVLLRRFPYQIETESFLLMSTFVFHFPFLNQERRHKELNCTIVVLDHPKQNKKKVHQILIKLCFQTTLLNWKTVLFRDCKLNRTVIKHPLRVLDFKQEKRCWSKILTYLEYERIRGLSAKMVSPLCFKNFIRIFRRVFQNANQRFPHVSIQRISNKNQSLSSYHLQHMFSIQSELQ